MAVRRQVVVDAAEQLIRETGSTDFTMTALADAAGVSHATPYNLFDSKAGLLYTLLNRSMDGIDDGARRATLEPDPFVRLMLAAEGVARFFTADSGFYRALYKFLLGVSDPVHRPDFMARAAGYWQRYSEPLAQTGVLPPEFPSGELAMELLAGSIGITDLWVHGELDDEAYIARAAYSALVLTVGFARGRTRQRLLGLMRDRRRRLTAHLVAAGATGIRADVIPSGRSARSRRVA